MLPVKTKALFVDNLSSSNWWIRLNFFPMPVMKPLQAFTILELIIVMILTAIVSAIIYLVLSIFMFQYSLFGKTASYMLDYYACKRLLERDISACHLLEKKADSLICANDLERIVYYFKEHQYIIRIDNGANIDTFRLQYEEPDWQMKVEHTPEVQLVGQLGVVVSSGREKYPWLFTKYYDESALFNFDTNN